MLLHLWISPAFGRSKELAFLPGRFAPEGREVDEHWMWGLIEDTYFPCDWNRISISRASGL
jgi:hypothetical protein